MCWPHPSLDATHIWLWGQGHQPTMRRFVDQHGCTGGMVTAVDLVRGLGVLTEMDVVEVEGATAHYDTNYEGKRDAALTALADGVDLFVIHVEATDEAGHAGDVDEKVQALENWDRRILADLVGGLDELGPWRMLLLPDHATPLRAAHAHARPGAVPDRRLAAGRTGRHLQRVRRRLGTGGRRPPADRPHARRLREPAGSRPGDEVSLRAVPSPPVVVRAGPGRYSDALSVPGTAPHTFDDLIIGRR